MDPDAAPVPLAARDEGRHRAGEGPWWAERWWFGWWESEGDGGPAGGFAELVLLPNQARAWYRAALVRPGHPLLAVVDHDVPMPRVGLELRGEGLWADHTVEASFEQWTVTNETYALAVDEPDELIGRGYGRPVPLAFDVEWYASAPAVSGAAVSGAAGYGQTGEVVGVVELGGAVSHAVHGVATRRHDWGPLALPDLGDAPADGARVPDRWPAPFAVVVDDVLTAGGWRRWRRP